jgi:hypothetical protein
VAAAAMGGTLRSGDALKSAVVERYVTGSGMGTMGSGALSGGLSGTLSGGLSGGLSGTLSGGLSGGLSAAGSLRPGELGPAAAAGVGAPDFSGGCRKIVVCKPVMYMAGSAGACCCCLRGPGRASRLCRWQHAYCLYA